MDNHMNLSNNAVATRINYVRGVRHLMMQTGKLPEDCTIDEIKSFLVKLRDTGQLSSSSINLRVCGLKYYFRHVVNRLDLVVGIPNPRIAKYHTEVLTTAELLTLFQSCRDVRQLLIVQLLFDTGMRSGELLRLELKDFDKTNRTIILRKAKGQKLRVIPYGEYVRTTLKAYIKMLGYFPKGAIIESYKEKGVPVSKRGLQHIVREVAKRSGLKKRISCHTLRHTYAVHFLNNGGHLPQLQKLLGHGHISTTLHYLKYVHLPLKQITTPLDIMMKS
jgi:site-specific recombinase XerD